ncbi:hypothetical protein [Nonomuraea basaltis]|uniref:hypothetical protein n=1 Tax=Nonomuraea basaltis TaxID=2495887 RepID=UPI00110C429C|nr:hypothetical protein [Nonomuraea basaltis]TMR94712.1 hypothetical protein EJK15_32330 [Nonomuraea basaltis]
MTSPNPTPPGWIVWSLRALATAHLAGVLAQAALAGLFVTGDVDLLTWHRNNGGFTHSLLYLQLVAAILLWRPGRGPLWPAVASLGIVAAETVQVALGQSRVIALHFPLGMAIFGLSAVFTAWTWRAGRASTP